MLKRELRELYTAYIGCLNNRDWAELALYVDQDVCRNGQYLGLDGYRDMLLNDCRLIPDLQFDVKMLIVDCPYLFSRIQFDCSPLDGFMGLSFGGVRVSFFEHVVYQFRNGRIFDVRSILDKSAVESQLLLSKG